MFRILIIICLILIFVSIFKFNNQFNEQSSVTQFDKCNGLLYLAFFIQFFFYWTGLFVFILHFIYFDFIIFCQYFLSLNFRYSRFVIFFNQFDFFEIISFLIFLILSYHSILLILSLLTYGNFFLFKNIYFLHLLLINLRILFISFIITFLNLLFLFHYNLLIYSKLLPTYFLILNSLLLIQFHIHQINLLNLLIIGSLFSSLILQIQSLYFLLPILTKKLLIQGIIMELQSNSYKQNLLFYPKLLSIDFILFWKQNSQRINLTIYLALNHLLEFYFILKIKIFMILQSFLCLSKQYYHDLHITIPEKRYQTLNCHYFQLKYLHFFINRLNYLLSLTFLSYWIIYLQQFQKNNIQYIIQMLNIGYYLKECPKSEYQYACIMQFIIQVLMMVIESLLIVNSYRITRKILKQGSRIKKRVGIIIWLSALECLSNILIDVFGKQFRIIQSFFQNLILSIIFLYFVKKINKSQNYTLFGISRSKILYSLVIFILIADLIFANIALIFSLKNYSFNIYKIFLIFQQFTSLIILLFEAILFSMIKTLKTRAIQSYKFNIRNFEDFKKNQYVIEGLHVYFLSIFLKVIAQFFTNFYLIFKVAEPIIYYVPKNFQNRNLLNLTFIFFIKLFSVYFPIFASQRLFKEYNIKKQKQSKQFEQKLEGSGFTISNNWTGSRAEIN